MNNLHVDALLRMTLETTPLGCFSLAQPLVYLTEVFTLPHVIHMDSTGFQCPIFQAKLAGTLPSPLESSPVWSSLVHWTPTGLQATFQSPVTVQWTESPVKVQWSPLDSTGLLPVVVIVVNY